MTDKPLAAAGLTSYRYADRYGFVMIGARDDADALRQAARSIDGTPDQARLEVWNGTRYTPALDALAAERADCYRQTITEACAIVRARETQA